MVLTSVLAVEANTLALEADFVDRLALIAGFREREDRASMIDIDFSTNGKSATS